MARRALKFYARYTRKNAIDRVNYMVEKFPFHDSAIRTGKEKFYQLLTYRGY